MAARKSTRVNRKYKTKYRVTNWPEYERGLKSRGEQTEQSRDNVPSLQSHRGLSDASERVGGTESRGKDRVQDSEHHDGTRDA